MRSPLESVGTRSQSGTSQNPLTALFHYPMGSHGVYLLLKVTGLYLILRVYLSLLLQ
ncbi:hypothetical protein [Nostoc sp.]|uniref:hypothetical protein n=1 Tax=Nostoc sp. TaxID=1180 RepID=UPI002FF57596